jgi:ectoine hydroxylase-related dioxygenase (phytanoyl-CoA dioxygenase family)
VTVPSGSVREIQSLWEGQGYEVGTKVAGTVAEMHSHPYDAQILILKGEMTIRVDGCSVHLARGQSAALAAGILHNEVCTGHVQILVGRRAARRPATQRLSKLAAHVTNKAGGAQLSGSSVGAAAAAAATTAATTGQMGIPGWPSGVKAPTYVRAPRLALGSEESLAYLDEHGYAVIADVLSPKEVEHTLGLQWDFMEGLSTGIDRNNPSTWTNEQWQPGKGAGTGILGSFGVGHNTAQWYLRTRPRVKAAWAHVLDTDDLICSFDGMCIFRPRGLDPSWTTTGGWFHTDRPILGPNGADRGYVQGFVNLICTTAAGGGNVIVPKSHRQYTDLGEMYKGEGGRIDNERLKQERPDIFNRAVYVHCEAGDVFL